MKVHFILQLVAQALHFELGHSGELFCGKLQRNNIHIPLMTLWRQPPTNLLTSNILPSCYLRKQKPTKLGYYKAKKEFPRAFQFPIF